jgi:hypothetical protein
LARVAAVLCLLLVTAGPALSKERVDWAPGLAGALKQARERRTLVFVAALIDSEPSCAMQKKALDDPRFVTASRDFVCVLANPMGTKDQRRVWNDVVTTYSELCTDGAGDVRVPFHLLLDHRGNVVTMIANGTVDRGFSEVSAEELVGALRGAIRSRRSAQQVVRAPAGRKPATIDHEDPGPYARIPKSAGDADVIRGIAADLKAETPERTLRRIHGFIADGVPDVPDPGWSPDHRNFDSLVTGFDHHGCASHGLLFANLARACGIPVVYIKSTRHSWIREFVATGRRGSFSGHVFLEVFVKGKWRLLDAQGMRIWDDYDPADPELPGGLLVYEKGWDHVAMVHSTQRDRYIEEALARWKGFDVSKLRENDAPGRSLLPKVYAVTVGGEWRTLGRRIPMILSFDRWSWKESHGKVKGNVFIVTSIRGEHEVPEDVAADWLPMSRKEIEKTLEKGPFVRTRDLADGTRVILLAASDLRAMKELIWRADLVRLACE